MGRYCECLMSLVHNFQNSLLPLSLSSSHQMPLAYHTTFNLLFCFSLQEPVGFFVGGFSSLASFGWFLKTRQDFTYEAMHKRTMTNYERKAFSDAQFNIVEYNRLTNEAENLREVMAAHEGQQKGS